MVASGLGAVAVLLLVLLMAGFARQTGIPASRFALMRLLALAESDLELGGLFALFLLFGDDAIGQLIPVQHGAAACRAGWRQPRYVVHRDRRQGTCLVVGSQRVVHKHF